MLGTAFTCVVLLAFQIVSVLLNYGIVWHERNSPEVKRTIINRINSNLSIMSAVHCVVALNSAMATSLRIGLPPWLCDFLAVCTNTLVVSFFAFTLLGALFRYFYTCVRRNVGAIDEDFLFCFVTLTSSAMSAYFAVLLAFSGRHRGLMWLKCVSCPVADPNAASPTKLKIMIGVAVVFAILYFSLIYLIWAQERTSKQANSMSGMAVAQRSFVDLPTSTVVVALATAAAVTFALSLLRSSSGPCLPYAYVCMVVLESIVLKGAYCARNRDMRMKIFGMYRTLFVVRFGMPMK